MQNNKVIYLIAGKGNRSGVPKYVCNLYTTLNRSYEIKVVVDGNEGGFDSVKKSDLIIIPGLASERSFRQKLLAIIKLRSKLKNADMVWAHSSFAILFSRILKFFCQYKLIITYHGLPFGNGRKIIINQIAFAVEFITSRLVKHTVVVISKLDEKNFLKLNPHVECTYIPNSVAKPSKVNNKFCNNQFKFLMTTRDSYQKNLDYAVKIMNQLPDIEVDVFGSISNSRKKYLTTLNLAKNMNFHGEVPFSSINFSNYRLYLMTSRYEGFSIGLLEACSYGLGIATTNVGGALEVAKNNDYCAILNNNISDDIFLINRLIESLKHKDFEPKIISRTADILSYYDWQERCLKLVEEV